jgi:putative colanic acid biosynthesis acetyltransferase WcaF
MINKEKIYRAAWLIIQNLIFRFIPKPLNFIRIIILKSFGARLHKSCMIYPSVKIWSPKFLQMEKGSTLGPGVNCYNPGLIKIGINSTISQGSHLCSGTHSTDRKEVLDNKVMELIRVPIKIGNYCWVCADAFISPGTVIGDGVVIAQRSVTKKKLESWSLYGGNPANKIKSLKKY